jgi:microcystin-dependent protein
MAMVRPKARILERSITAGNGPYVLGGAVDGSYNTFSAFMADGDATYVSVVEPGVAFWTGIATYAAAANTITLTTVEEAKGTFGSGSKEIMSGALASTAMFREDIAGAIATGGSSTAYTVASYRKYDTLTRLDGNIIAFTPHVTNGAGPIELEVDALGFKPLRTAPGIELFQGTLIRGTPYLALYNHSDDAFYLHGFFGNPYNVPLGVGIDYWASTAPNSAFAFPIGQAISRTTYAALFSLVGTTYGSGDGSTTFNLPDKTGRVSAMIEATQTRLPLSYFGGNLSTVPGSAAGNAAETLTNPNLPPYTPAGTNAAGTTDHAVLWNDINGIGSAVAGGLEGTFANSSNTNASRITVTPGVFTGTAQGGTSTPFSIVQPTILCNYILRVL